MTSVREYIESRGIESSGGRSTSQRTFFAEGYSNPADVYGLIGGATVPRAGDAHPNFPGLTARDFSIQPVSGHTDLWKIDWTYEQTSHAVLAYPPNVPQQLPNEVDYVEASAEIRAEFQLGWRIGTSSQPLAYPDEGNPADDEVEVEGQSIDAAGIPTSRQRNIQEITLTETVNSPVRLEDFAQYRFFRNSTKFLQFDAGVVVYRGCSIRRTGVDVYQVAHQFVADDDFHLQQQPKVDQFGEPYLKDDRAEFVYWVQPFPKQRNLNSISRNF